MDRVALQIPCDFQMMQSINGISLTQHKASQPNWRVPCFSYPKTRRKKDVWFSWDYIKECIAYDSGYCDELLVLPFQEYWIHRVSIVFFLSGSLHFWEKYCMHVLVGKVWFPWTHVCKTYRGIWCQREGHLNKFKRRRKGMWALLYTCEWLVTMKSNRGRKKCSNLPFVLTFLCVTSLLRPVVSSPQCRGMCMSVSICHSSRCFVVSFPPFDCASLGTRKRYNSHINYIITRSSWLSPQCGELVKGTSAGVYSSFSTA